MHDDVYSCLGLPCHLLVIPAARSKVRGEMRLNILLQRTQGLAPVQQNSFLKQPFLIYSTL